MSLSSSVSITNILVQALLLAAPAHVRSTHKSSCVTLSTPRQMNSDIRAVPCDNEKRMAGVKALFEKMGARPADLSIQNFGAGENLLLRKRGRSEKLIVIGAHYDKVAAGCGAVDNWSGIVTLAHIYRTLKNVSLDKTVIFVAFGEEEAGLLGSRAMAKGIGRDQSREYCAMINLDSLGVSSPRVAENISSKRLVKITTDLARRKRLPFGKGFVGGDSDSSSFVAEKVPALTIYGLRDDDGGLIHSEADRPAKIKPINLYWGYILALGLTINIDRRPCNIARES
jgi:hypothetical protein